MVSLPHQISKIEIFRFQLNLCSLIHSKGIPILTLNYFISTNNAGKLKAWESKV